MKKLIFIILIVSNYIYASEGAALYAKCGGCHGQKGELVALGKSKVIATMSKDDIKTALMGYKDGTYGGAMAGVMKGQLSDLNKEKIVILAEHITYLDKLEEYEKIEIANRQRLEDIFSKAESKEKPDFEMKDIYGNSIRIKLNREGFKVYGLEDKIIFIDLFGHYGHNFMKLRHFYSKLQTKYKDDLAVISIEVQNANDEKLKEIALKSPSKGIMISWSNAKDFLDFLKANNAWNAYVPSALVIDKKYKLKEKFTVEGDFDYLSKIIDRVK